VKKIPTIFQRNHETDHLVRDEIVPGCEWVFEREGVATIKWDGTACLIRDGKLFKRYELKKGKTPKPGFEPAQEADPITGDIPGWIPVGDESDSQYHREAFAAARGTWPDGTYELIGPKIQGNPHGVDSHMFKAHGDTIINGRYLVRTFEGLRDYLQQHEIEGIVSST